MLVLCFHNFILKLHAGLCLTAIGELTQCYIHEIYSVKKINSVNINKVLLAVQLNPIGSSKAAQFPAER